MESRCIEYSPVVDCLVPIVLLICSSSASEFIHNSSAVLISKESSDKLLKHTNTTYGNAMYIHFAACSGHRTITDWPALALTATSTPMQGRIAGTAVRCASDLVK